MLLGRNGYTPLIVVLVLIALLHNSCTELTEEEDLCDLTGWYTEAESDGAFVDADPDVKAIEAEVRMLLEAQGDEATIKCTVITGWEELIYNTEEGGKGAGESSGGEAEHEEADEGNELLEDDDAPNALPVLNTMNERHSATDKKEDEGDGSSGNGDRESDDVKKEPAGTGKVKDLEMGLDSIRDVIDPDNKQEAEKEPDSKERKNVSGEDPGRESGSREAKHSPPVKELILDDDRPSDKSEEQSDQTMHTTQVDCMTKKDTHQWTDPTPSNSEHESPKGEETSQRRSDAKEPTPEITPATPAAVSGDTLRAEPTRERVVSHPELLAERLLAEQLRADYSAKVKDLETQLLKMENRLLADKADQYNNSNSQTKLENQLLRLENELLKINASFTILRVENAHFRAQIGTEGKGQYPALPDKNTTIVASLVDKHQSRISELSDVITKQTDVITALDKKAELMEERNGELRQTLVTQSDMIKDIVKHIEELRDMQSKQHHHQEMETKRLYDVIASVEDTRNEIMSQKNESDSRNLSAPNTLGAMVHAETDGAEMKGANVELPQGTAVGKEAEQVKEQAVGNQEPQKEPDLPQTQPDGEARLLKAAEEEVVQDGPSVPSKTVPEKSADVVSQEVAAAAVTEKPPLATGYSAPGTTPKIKMKKMKSKKKKVLKKKGVEKKVIKKKRKVLKKAGSVAVPPPKYVDDSYKGFKDCFDHFLAGRKRDTPQRIRPIGQSRDSDVCCDMRNGGWTVILKRQDGSTDFYKNWAEYQRGFGGTYSDHWAGLELIHRITNQGHYQLRVDLTDWKRNSVFAVYDLVRVEGEDQGYRLHISGYSGTAGDGFMGHSGMQFSTWDKDNDLAVKDFGGSCATRFHGAWWYNKCFKSNPTGRYYRGGQTAEGKHDGVAWKPWTGSDVSLKRVEIKIRAKV